MIQTLPSPSHPPLTLLFIIVISLLGRSLQGTDVSTGNAINTSGCLCTSTECCIYVGQTLKAALTVTLSHKDSPLTQPKGPFSVRLVNCAGTGPGPTFSDGSRSKNQDCDNTAVPYDLRGGSEPGNFKVFIHYNDQCYDCGSICVFDTDPDTKNGHPNAFDYPPGFIGPDGSSPVAGKEDSIAQLWKLVPAWVGPLCIVGGALVPKGTIDGVPIFSFTAQKPDGRIVTGSVFTGTDGKAPDGSMGTLLGAYTDDCADRVEAWCLKGFLTYFYYDSCTKTYYKIATCLWFHGNNFPSLLFSRCGRKFKLTGFNLSNENADNSKERNSYKYEVPTDHLTAGAESDDGKKWNRTGDIPGYPSGSNGGTAPPLRP